MITFVHPEYFFLLLLLIPYWCWQFLFKKRREATFRIADVYAYHFIKKSLRIRLLGLPVILHSIVWILLVVVLARPQTTNNWSSERVEGIDIMFVVDISTSMLAEDLKPNRIDATKDVAIEFISSRPNDNIGLTVFAGESYTQCPMTTDHRALLSLFQQVGCEMPQHGLIEDGTAIGMGIASAVARLKDSKAKSKVIILLTDGSNNRGDISPLTSAEIAQKYGIRIYTIGVGTNGMASYPYPLPGGGVRYGQMPVEIDTTTLSEIAKLTQGVFYRADSKHKLKEIHEEIDKLEKTKYQVESYSNKYEMFQLFALVAFILLIVEIIIRELWLKKLT